LGASTTIGYDNSTLHSDLDVQYHHRTTKTRKITEESTRLLSEWLAAHRDHPYPKDYEKQEFEKITGLQRGKIPYLSCFSQLK
jgi:hypothetical protein